MSTHRRHAVRSTPPRFQHWPLVAAFMALIGRRSFKRRTAPDPEWERDEPMTGLS